MDGLLFLHGDWRSHRARLQQSAKPKRSPSLVPHPRNRIRIPRSPRFFQRDDSVRFSSIQTGSVRFGSATRALRHVGIRAPPHQNIYVDIVCTVFFNTDDKRASFITVKCSARSSKVSLRASSIAIFSGWGHGQKTGNIKYWPCSDYCTCF